MRALPGKSLTLRGCDRITERNGAKKGRFLRNESFMPWPAPYWMKEMKETLAGQTGKPLPLVAARRAVVVCRRIFQCNWSRRSGLESYETNCFAFYAPIELPT